MTARAQLGAARRVVVKVGSSSLTSLSGGLDPQRLDALVDALAVRRATGTQVVLVSSGAIAAGLAPLGLARRPRDLATQQAAAAVGQLQLAQTYGASFGRHGFTIGQVLLTADDMIRRAHYRNAQRTLERLLGLDVLPVVNENDTVATDEIRVGDNDRLAALVAHIVGADGLVLLSDVDGLYDGDPRRPGARLVAEVDEPAGLAAVTIARPGAASLGTGGMATKITAAAMASAAGIPVLLAAATARRWARPSARPGGACRRAGSGSGTPLTCTAASTWTGARPPLCCTGAAPCSPPGSAGCRATSWRATSWTSSTRTARWWRAASSGSTPPSCPTSSAAAATSCRPRSAARSCTPTTSSPCTRSECGPD